MEFIDQSLSKVLPDGGRSTSDSDILSVGGSASSFKRDANPICNEMKGGASLHFEWSTRMMSEHKNLLMIHRVITPPTSPALIQPRTAHWPEHISAHNPGTYIVEAPRRKVLVDTGLSVLLSEQMRLKRASRESPSMKGSSANAKRVLQALVRACAKASIEMVKLSTRSLVIWLFFLLSYSGERVLSRLTTQAQRPGARDATIATATLPPGSLQRMVRHQYSGRCLWSATSNQKDASPKRHQCNQANGKEVAAV
jgi:hypothetical protein